MKQPTNFEAWLKSFAFVFFLYFIMNIIVDAMFPVCVENYNPETFNWFYAEQIKFVRKPFWNCNYTYDQFLQSFWYYSNKDKYLVGNFSVNLENLTKS